MFEWDSIVKLQNSISTLLIHVYNIEENTIDKLSTFLLHKIQ